MEFKQKSFTPKAVSKAALRPSPYSSSVGKSCISNYKKYNSYSIKNNSYVTPPRKSFISINSNQRQISSTGKLKSFRCTTAQNTHSRGINILRQSQQQCDTKENSLESKWLEKPEIGKLPLVKSAKRSLTLGSRENNDDPHGIFVSDDEDDDIFLADRYQAVNLDKENNNVTKSYRASTFLKSTAKRKPLNTLHSSLFDDINPKKISPSYPSRSSFSRSSSSKKENCLYTFKSFGNKENNLTSIPSEEKSIPITEQPYQIGFLNYGNTCYLNAVLQTLISLEPFVIGISSIIHKVGMSSSSLTRSLWDVIIGRKRKDTAAVMKALRSLKENVEKIDGSFSGFKMQDANEFLTQVLDTIKDEVDKCIIDDDASISLSHSTKSITKESKMTTHANNDHSSLFDTPSPDSIPSLDLKLSDFNSSDEEREEIFTNTELKQNAIVSLTPEKSVNSKLSIFLCDNTATPAKKIEDFVNPVKENFEFELLESYRCLGCGDTERRKQKHFALYVNLPTDGNESIQHAVESYMMEDQRELTCEKCNHKKASVITQFENLPRVLIVQLKRYEYKPEQLECIKVSSKVEVNMWLQLDSISSQTGKSPPPWTDKLLRVDTLVDARRKETKLNSTLSVRNLSSELNICDRDKEFSVKKDENSRSEQDIKTETCDKSYDKELEEVIIPSQDDNGELSNTSNLHQPDTEEEELQKAIKLSLQEVGMCFSHDIPSTGTNEESSHFCNNVQLLSGEKETEKELTLQELNGKHSYRLLSVISHFGLTTCTGHYVSDIFNFDENQWFHYDDESVVRLQDSVVVAEGRQKNGYIFFYVHQDVYGKLRS